MAEKIQLSIPEPCHENWDAMTPSEQGRFCSSCQKQVVDFSLMSDRQIIAYFKQPRGSVCGRLHEDQLNRNIETPKKRLPWIKYFFQFALPAFLVSCKNTSNRTLGLVMPKAFQTEKANNEISIPVAGMIPSDIKSIEIDVPKQITCSFGTVGLVSHVPDDVVKPDSATQAISSIEGKVTDTSGNPIPYASVIIKGTSRGVACDSLGKFQLEVNNHKLLQISAAGFVGKEIEINGEDKLSISLDALELKPVIVSSDSHYLLGGIAGGISVRRVSKTNPVIQMIKDTITKKLKLFPNPVVAGSYVTLQWKNLSAGDYLLQLTDNNGRSIHKETLMIDDEITSLQFQVPNVAAGIYFIQLNNSKGKVLTEKLLVQ
jgi:hypothetical protein